jgi:glycosyltransferase involved in cell wall biosynthesis
MPKKTIERSFFNAVKYGSEHPDVVLSGLSPQKHFSKYGKYLGRSQEFDAVPATSLDIYRPKVSVVCICFNHQDFIEKTIVSLLAQVVDFDVEFIVMDDCSSDSTPDIVRRLTQNDERVRFIARTQNIGSASNFGEALALVRGEYVALCDGDDYWTDETKLKRQVEFLDQNPDCSICFHPVVVEYEDGRESDIFPADTGPFNALRLGFGNFIQTNSVMYRWRWGPGQIEQVFSKEVSPSDWMLHLQHAEAGGIGFINRPMAVYRKHSGGIWWGSGSSEHKLRHGPAEIAFYLELSRLFGGAFSEHCASVRKELATLLVRHYILSDDINSMTRLRNLDSEATVWAMSELGFDCSGFDPPEGHVGWSDILTTPIISVIVLTYNHGRTIEQCLRSVFQQSGPLKIQLIIGDDCSKDDTVGKIDELISSAPDNVSVLFLQAAKNMGMKENLKRCLNAATGDYVAFCEGDDYWLSSLKLIKQLLCLQQDQSLSMCFNWILLENQIDNTLLAHPQQSELNSTVLTQHDIFVNPVTANFSCCMYRATSIASVDDRYYQAKIPADWLFNLFVSSAGPIGYIRELLSVYRIHSGGQWSRLSPDTQKNAFLEAQTEAKALLGKDLITEKYKLVAFPSQLPNHVKSWLELPEVSDLYRGRILLRGWAFDDSGERLRIVARYGGERYMINLNETRKDVVDSLQINSGTVRFEEKIGFKIGFTPQRENFIDLEIQVGIERPIPWVRICYWENSIRSSLRPPGPPGP